MIKEDDLLDLFERMKREHWNYEWGAAREGCVDCSGAFVYAYKQLGGPSIAHGSNTILRKSMGALLPIGAAKPGYAAVKVRAWDGEEIGNRWYGMEPGDCYHIGLVGRNGKILNAKGTAAGFVASDPDEGWEGCAPLLAVDYSAEAENVLYRAKVETEKDPLRIRNAPVSGSVVGNAPRGALVDVLEDNGDGWPRIQYFGVVGYVSGEFLRPVEHAEETPDTGDAKSATTLVRGDGTTITLFGSWRVAND